MIPELKQFIEENIDLIDDNQFNDVYNKLRPRKYTSRFTEAMLQADINPLNYMTEVPEYYLYESDLRRVNIPTGIVAINKYAFLSCRILEEVTIPEGVINIGECAFMNCGIWKLHLPSTLKYIDIGAFQGCMNLSEITFAGTTKQWIAVNDLDGSLLRFERVKCSDN